MEDAGRVTHTWSLVLSTHEEKYLLCYANIIWLFWQEFAQKKKTSFM